MAVVFGSGMISTVGIRKPDYEAEDGCETSKPAHLMSMHVCSYAGESSHLQSLLYHNQYAAIKIRVFKCRSKPRVKYVKRCRIAEQPRGNIFEVHV